MEVRNCRSCQRLFNYSYGIPICDACKARIEEKFQQVKAYVRDYRSAPISEVSENCNVSVKQIKQWVREERLIFAEDSGVYLECEKCGAPIRMGRFCEHCKGQMHSELEQAYEKPAAFSSQEKKMKGRDEMRFLGKDGK